MKKSLFLLFFIISTCFYAQKTRSTKVGEIKDKELLMQKYDKDTTANAVVLYEHANYYVNELQNFKKTTDYYFRIKILKKEGFDKATIDIPIYNVEEEVSTIKAKTYNLDDSQNKVVTELSKDAIYVKGGKVSFTLPNIKVGSVIEYQYSITTPYSSIRDWYFQSDIPKVKSDFTAAIVGNYKYDIRVIGNLTLTKDIAVIKKNCVYVPIIGIGACLDISYGIDDIPAFTEEEFMLSKRNYISRLHFELKSYTKLDGMVKNFTKTWKAADKSIKNTLLDGQSSKNNFFKRKVVPKEILLIKDELARSKKIFQLIKNNFNWNGNYWPARKVNIKSAYENKSGNIFDINLSLYNALKAAKIDCKVALLSTRSKGLVTKLHPTDQEFNYLVVRAIINDKTYYLDATDKILPFGLVRFEALNGSVRVLDFKKGSFWDKINVTRKNSISNRVTLELIDNVFKGNITTTYEGYSALNKRRSIGSKSKEEILNDFESLHPMVTSDNLKLSNLKDIDSKLKESYTVSVDSEISSKDLTLINPFYIKYFQENPFKAKERSYPVDFGYNRSYSYMLSIKLPKYYLIKKLPKNTAISLPNKAGKILFNVSEKDNIISMYLKATLNKNSFKSVEYSYIKEFFNQFIKIQESYIEIIRE